MFSIFLIGVSLSMDAFAIAVANGMTLEKFSWKHAVWMGLYFGAFQFLMPLIGCLLGSTVSSHVSTLGPYISFVLLAFIGGKMLFDSIKGGDEAGGMLHLKHSRLLVMAIATSIDALAVGVSFAFMDIKLVPSCLLIGCTTFAISFAGAMLGSKIPGVSGKKAGIIGGLVLIGIGIKLLVEGVFL